VSNWKTILLFFIFLPFWSQGQLISSEEYALRDKTVSFLHQVTDDLRLFSEQADSVDATDEDKQRRLFQRSKLFSQLKEYLAENQTTYNRLRRTSFKKLETPPQYLEEELKFIPLTDLAMRPILNNTDYLKLITLRTTTAEPLIAMLDGFVFPAIAEKLSNGLDELNLIKRMGALTYGRELSKDKWQLLMVNRLYSLTFNYDLVTQRIDEIRFAILPVDFFDRVNIKFEEKAKISEKDLLRQRLKELSWNLAGDDHFWDQPRGQIVQALAEERRSFFMNHLDQYTRIRKALLSRFPAVEAIPPGFKQKTTGDGFSEAFIDPDLEFQNADIFDVEDLNIQLVPQIMHQSNAGKKPNYKEIGLNIFMGYLFHASSTENENIWQIQAVGYNTMLMYQWDITTGEIADISYYEKE